MTLLLKVGFFSEPPKYWPFSSLAPSYLLKVTKFFVKISQFEFLVMTEKNIFVYKLFCHWIFQILIYFYVKIATPLKKVTPFLRNPPLKVEVLSSHPFLKIWLEVQPPPPTHSIKGRVHTMATPHPTAPHSMYTHKDTVARVRIPCFEI